MSDNQPSERTIGILVRDLMFSSKIIAEAKAAGVAYKMIRDPKMLGAVETDLCILIVDLNLEGAIAAAADWRAKTNHPVIGFVSHVDSETIATARAAGIDQILPRSRFVQVLPELVRG